MAHKTIAYLQARRQEQLDKFVKERMQAEINDWWFRLWNKKASTYEEAVDSLQNEKFCVYWMIASQYNDQMNVANRILRACGQADEIYLSTKDLANIL